ncbi:MAG: tRNA (adenosine(37)-N6)-dimethylallyltransferase MiaA [Myxococcota bacterium]
MTEEAPVLCILGPTASGKSALALEVAEKTGGEIVSCDSAQVFRGLDVGTAKATVEEQARVPHHLIDQIPPDAQWTAAEFAQRADKAVAEVRARGRLPILCGGTGLWYRAWLRGIFEAPPISAALRAQVLAWLEDEGSAAVHARLARHDPKAAARIPSGDPQRIGRALEYFLQTGQPISEAQDEHGFRGQRYAVRAFGLTWPRALSWERIRARTEWMYRHGLLEEAEAALRTASPDAPGLRIIGYRDAVRVVLGKTTLAEAVDATSIATRQFAKRQRNWFNQETLRWLDGQLSVETLASMVLDPPLPSA